MIKAVLFDFDGVLVDSMSFHVQAWQDVYREFDIEIQPEDILLTEGSKSIDLAGKIFNERQKPISETELNRFVAEKQDRYREITRAKIENGAEELLRRLQEHGLQLGLVTGSTLANVRAILCPNVVSLFDVIITGDETCNGKPAPEPYLKAAQKLRVKPANCLVVENAPLGIQAACSAGMKVVALTTTLSRHHLKGADYFFNNVAELKDKWQEIFSTVR
ncbi:MAG: HAD family hydrolase [bacterium]